MTFIWAILIFSSQVMAYQSSLTPSGNELFWSNDNVPVSIQANTSDLTQSDVTNIIHNSFEEWNLSSRAKVFSSSTSKNEIKFLRNFPYGSAVIGVTELTFNSSGTIQRGVISLNDDYLFKKTPGRYPYGQVYLGDVVTHEIGHLFGLSHSEVLDATMFYSSFSGQSSIALDDQSGIRNKYDTDSGKISGFVKGGNSIGVLGVHVQAISLKDGQSVGAVTDENGHFEIGGLELNNTYYLYTSPVKKLSSLPGYFSNSQTSFCPGSFVGSFFHPCGREFDGKPTGINLTESLSSVDVGTVTINCHLKSDPNYDLQKISSPFLPLTVFDYSTENKTEKSFVGWFRKTSSSSWSSPDLLKIDLSGYYLLGGPAKYLKVDLISYPFGNLIEHKMTIKRESDITPIVTKNITESSVSKTWNTNLSALVALNSTASLNKFEISISTKNLDFPGATFPSVDDFTNDKHLPYLLMMSVWQENSFGIEHISSTEAVLSDNESCLDGPFTYAVSKTRSESISSSSEITSNEAAVAGASCGTVGGPPTNGSGPSWPLMGTGFFLVIIIQGLLNSRKKFLS